MIIKYINILDLKEEEIYQSTNFPKLGKIYLCPYSICIPYCESKNLLFLIIISIQRKVTKRISLNYTIKKDQKIIYNYNYINILY